jgi:2-iminobutanoate/2-iminopropanoate deaminase
VARLIPVPVGDSPTGAPYSPAVRFGPLLFVSGHFGTSPEFARRIEAARARGEPLPSMAELPFDEQVHQTMRNLAATLAAAGASLDCILQATVHLKRQEDAGRFDAIYRTYFKTYFPARTRLQAGRLPFDTAVEIEAIAYVPGVGFEEGARREELR